LKAAYTIPEIAALAGISRGRARRILESNHVELRRNGRVIVVYLSALKRALPDLWESILDREAANDRD
jgi:hypothetical protein